MIFNQSKVWLTLVIFLTILTYHLLEILSPDTLGGSYSSIFALIKLSTIAVFLYFLIRSEVLTKLLYYLFKWDFIGGKYKGKSVKKLVKNEERDISFTIKHSFIETIILGVSYDKDKKQVSSWSGPLFKIDSHDYCFALYLSGDYGEYGILKLTFDKSESNNIIITGKYWSGDQINPALFDLIDCKKATTEDTGK